MQVAIKATFQYNLAMQKVLVIEGPTAVGKSAFGVACAKAFNGEIISGDSIQIYRGLDIGSAKITASEMQGVKHHLIDIKNADESYSVKEFQDLARNLISYIGALGKLPIIVGGTGLYIKACLYDYEFRQEDSQDRDYQELSNEEIYAILKVKDPECLNKIHINNRKRLVRALNVIERHNEKFSDHIAAQRHELLYDAKIIGLTCQRAELYRRIDERVDKMIADGLIAEVQVLLNQGINFDHQSMQAIGYKELRPYFENQTSLDDCITMIKRNSRHFAKRQYTWFNNQTPIEWYDNTKQSEALKEVALWMKS